MSRGAKLVSQAGGQARLVGGEGGGAYAVEMKAEGVTLEELAVVPETNVHGTQQRVVRVQRGGVAVLRGCDLAGRAWCTTAAQMGCWSGAGARGRCWWVRPWSAAGSVACG